MNTRNTSRGRGRLSAACALVAALAVASVPASAGSRGAVCTVNPGACLKTAVVGKAMPGVVVVPATGATTARVPVTVFLACPLTNICGTVCGAPAAVTSASLAVRLYAGACPPPSAAPPPPALAGGISTVMGTMGLPACSSAGAFTNYLVPVIVPAGAPRGAYCVSATLSVAYSDGLALRQSGDTVVCLVDPAPGQPGVPRLNLELLSDPAPRMAPGDQHVAQYRVTNNDPSNAVTVRAYATSRQVAVRPQGGNETQGVFSVANPFGDDFPIRFNPGPAAIPLPSRPYTQPVLTNTLPVIPPGGMQIVLVGIRSYGPCANGSCSESSLILQGLFADGSPALAGGGLSLFVDTSMPSINFGTLVNDCNANGVPDADDLDNRTAQDSNYNGTPDPCETSMMIPFFSDVSPRMASVGEPLQVRLHVQAAGPPGAQVTQAWANGHSLAVVPTGGFYQCLGVIPADARPGPQTVFFVARNGLGNTAARIATYECRAATRITAAYFSGADFVLEHTGTGVSQHVVLERSAFPPCPTCWTPLPGGPHPSPVNAGVPTESQLYRLTSFVPVTEGQGVTFSQVDFTFLGYTNLDSNTAEMEVDLEALRAATGAREGYLNVGTSNGWVVQNLPVHEDITYPRVATTFMLNPDGGVAVTSLSARVFFTPSILTNLFGGTSTTFGVGKKEVNAEGKNATNGPSTIITSRPPVYVEFTTRTQTIEWTQPKHPNIEAAVNQCGPAAKANSLQWLEDTYGSITIPQTNTAGLGADGSLVGALETAMGRGATSRTNGSPVSDAQYLNGVLGYIGANGLGDKIKVKHQDDGTFGGPGGGNVTNGTQVSEGNGKPTAAFIIQEIAAGEDVEIGYTNPGGGGHWVNAVKAGWISGVPFVHFVSDGNQRNDSAGTTVVDFGYLVDTDGDGLPNLVGVPGTPNVDIVVSESPK